MINVPTFGIPPRTRRAALATIALASVPASLGLSPALLRAEITPDRLRAHVTYLASDALAGRAPGTAGGDSALAYVEHELRGASLEPLFADGYRQSFTHEGTRFTNVGAMLRGESDQYVILGAHVDHLGVAADDPSKIYNGADDNASGVAALIEVARELTEGPIPRRSIAFLAFDGEEQGLLGSAHYAEAPALPLDACAAMINLDSVGRLRDDRLVVFGTGTAASFDATVDGLNRAHGFALAKNTDGVGAGDHQTFFERGIPVLHLFTDGHLDYHQPTDTADKIDYESLARVAAFATDLVDYLADDAVVLSFVPAGAEKVKVEDPGTGRRTVTLGTIPDFAKESGGVRVSGLVPGSPAEGAGVLVDDVIVDIDGTPVDNLYDYSAVLKNRSPGDEIAITLVRGDERLVVKAVLVKRR